MRSGTFSQIRYHVVFAVKYRRPLLQKSWRPELFAYMAGTIVRLGGKPFIINGVEDHVHLLFALGPGIAPMDIIRKLKKSSGEYVKSRNLIRESFSWQDGYSIFSVGRTEFSRVYAYIKRQEEHHEGQGFSEEYRGLLDSHQISYQEQFLFDNESQ